MTIDLLRCALPEAPDPALAEALLRPRIWHAALDALSAARARPEHATPVLSRYFREARSLGSKERPVAAEAVYGVIRHGGLLERLGAGDDPERLRLWGQLVAGERFESLASEGPGEDYATALSLPLAVAEEWLARLGPEQAAALGASLGGRAALTLRVNRVRADRDGVAARLRQAGVETEHIDGLDDALRLLGRANAPALPGFREGHFEVQDASSQRLIAALAPLLEAQGGQARVLDLAAGAGGKTLALAALGATVHAWDTRSYALDELWKRARRAGVERRIHIGPPEPAPLVLLDAPCTGLGRLRRDPALRWGFQADRYLMVQRQLLSEAEALVAPGGLLVYATCSLLEAENGHAPSPRLSPVGSATLWPHRDGSDGFFWSIWRRD